MKKHILIRVLSAFLLLITLSAHAQNYSKVTYIHTDADGSPFAATDSQGSIEWQIDNYPYGKEYSNTEVARKSEISFAGKPYDEEIGLSYFGARWYDPDIGRFTGIDAAPVDPNDYRTFNRYSYGFNNPYKYVDPDGNLPILIPIAIFIAKEIAAEGASRATGGLTDFLSLRRIGTKVIKRGVGVFSKKNSDVVATNGLKPSTGPLKNTSGSLDAAANAARNQRGSNPLTQHSRERMAIRNVTNDRVQEAIDKGALSSTRGSAASRTISASESSSGRGLTVIQDVKTNRVITVIDKGSGAR